MTFDEVPPELTALLERASDQLGPFGNLRYAADVESTNDIAMTLALAGARSGTSVLADHQRRGRGRRGNRWFSPLGRGIYLSVVVEPSDALKGIPLVTLAAGVAVARAVRTISGLPVELKWPNDIVIGRPWRKIGGVLCEAASAGPTFDAIVVGLGVNLGAASYPPELTDRATSVEIELGRVVERGPLIVAILVELKSVMAELLQGEADRIRGDWRALGAAGLGGGAVRWRDGENVRRGRARDIDTDGALIVEVDGRRERLVAGEVHWEALSRA